MRWYMLFIGFVVAVADTAVGQNLILPHTHPSNSPPVFSHQAFETEGGAHLPPVPAASPTSRITLEGFLFYLSLIHI